MIEVGLQSKMVRSLIRDLIIYDEKAEREVMRSLKPGRGFEPL
ncbi:MAG: hypothetical protein QW706_01710 [Candidatus Nezhaarchaeales archaeon]